MLTITLIIDTRKELPTKYKKILEDDNNQVIISSNILNAFEIIRNQEPDLIIISDSIEEELTSFCSKIRIMTYNMRPVIVAISKSAEIQDKINVLKSGADDFMSEPINTEEFKMRIFAHIRREYESYLDIKTNLPNGNYCMRALKRTLFENSSWGALLIEIKHFDDYKNAYTELASDKLIKTFSAIMTSALDKLDFLGSINENEFLIITNSIKLEKIASFLTFAFDSVKEKFYSQEDVKRGYMIIQGDALAGKRGEFISLIIGGISNEFNNYENINQILEELMSTRALADNPISSNFVIQRPRISTPCSVLKKEINKRILVIEPDEAMQLLLTTSLNLEGYTVSIPDEINTFESFSPALIILDTGEINSIENIDICKQIKIKKLNTKIIVTSNTHYKESILDAGADYYLPKPYEISTLLKWVNYFMKEINQ